MSGALGETMEFGMKLLRRNRFCMGVRRGKRYVCGGDADEDSKSKTVELLSEAVRRIQRWRVWEAWWVEEWMDEWLEKRDRLEAQLRGKYDDEVINGLLGMVDKFIGYNEDFWRYWHDVGGEVRKLIDDLMNGRTEVIIRGEDASGVSVHGEHITLKVDKTSTGGITVQLVLNGLDGVTIKVPNVFRKTMSEREYRRFVRKVLKALRGGLEETDGFNSEGKAAMSTTQIWQVIVWTLLYFSRMYVHIDIISVNEGSVTITWLLISSHGSLKGKLLNNADKLSEEEILALTFTAVLGDGSARIIKDVRNRVYEKARINITMSDKKFEIWLPLLMRLKEMGFNWGKPSLANDNNEVTVPFYGSNAISLARAMMNVLPSVLRDVLDALTFEKWKRIRQIAEMEVKFRIGESQIIVAGYKFTVNIQKRTVGLVHRTKDGIEAESAIETLKAVYGDEFHARVNKSGKYLVVTIPMYVFRKYDDIKEQVVEVLYKKLEKAKDEKKRQDIVRILRRLAPIEETAAIETATTHDNAKTTKQNST